MKILIIGQARTGKTTAANYLSKLLKCHTFSLADPLKKMVFQLLRLFEIPIDSIEDLYSDDKKEKYRHYMQQVGTECCREMFGKDVWCNVLNDKLQDSWIIADVRFQNEFEYFCEKYPDVITIGITRTIGGFASGSHTSENDTQYFKHKIQHHINNNGTIEELHDELRKIINMHR